MAISPAPAPAGELQVSNRIAARPALYFAVAVLCVYALPAILGLLRNCHPPDVADYDDRLYLARIVAA